MHAALVALFLGAEELGDGWPAPQLKQLQWRAVCRDYATVSAGQAEIPAATTGVQHPLSGAGQRGHELVARLSRHGDLEEARAPCPQVALADLLFVEIRTAFNQQVLAEVTAVIGVVYGGVGPQIDIALCGPGPVVVHRPGVKRLTQTAMDRSVGLTIQHQALWPDTSHRLLDRLLAQTAHDRLAMAGTDLLGSPAKLVGIKTFGKGSVQQIEDMTGGGELKVTVAKWYTPNGKNINKEGIDPDVKVELSDDDIKNARDPQKDKAYSLVKGE